MEFYIVYLQKLNCGFYRESFLALFAQIQAKLKSKSSANIQVEQLSEGPGSDCNCSFTSNMKMLNYKRATTIRVIYIKTINCAHSAILVSFTFSHVSVNNYMCTLYTIGYNVCFRLFLFFVVFLQKQKKRCVYMKDGRCTDGSNSTSLEHFFQDLSCSSQLELTEISILQIKKMGQNGKITLSCVCFLIVTYSINLVTAFIFSYNENTKMFNHLSLTGIRDIGYENPMVRKQIFPPVYQTLYVHNGMPRSENKHLLAFANLQEYYVMTCSGNRILRKNALFCLKLKLYP